VPTIITDVFTSPDTIIHFRTVAPGACCETFSSSDGLPSSTCVVEEMSVMPLVARAGAVMPRIISEAGAGISVTMIDACRSARSNPGNRSDATKPGGGASRIEVPVTRMGCATTYIGWSRITTNSPTILMVMLSTTVRTRQ